MVVQAIEEQLLHAPTAVSRNRKPLRPNPVAPWVLRVGQLRVCYEVESGSERAVTIRAIGVKDRQRVTIGGVEIDL